MNRDKVTAVRCHAYIPKNKQGNELLHNVS